MSSANYSNINSVSIAKPSRAPNVIEQVWSMISELGFSKTIFQSHITKIEKSLEADLKKYHDTMVNSDICKSELQTLQLKFGESTRIKTILERDVERKSEDYNHICPFLIGYSIWELYHHKKQPFRRKQGQNVIHNLTNIKHSHYRLDLLLRRGVPTLDVGKDVMMPTDSDDPFPRSVHDPHIRKSQEWYAHGMATTINRETQHPMVLEEKRGGEKFSDFPVATPIQGE
ncbi:hypothetical protein LXL04_027092 [Taraxacum kok-saghyz]